MKESSKLDIIITEIGLPLLSGGELIKEIRDSESYMKKEETPIIATYENLEEVEPVRELRAISCMPKGETFREILQNIDKVLAKPEGKMGIEVAKKGKLVLIVDDDLLTVRMTTRMFEDNLIHSVTAHTVKEVNLHNIYIYIYIYIGHQYVQGDARGNRIFAARQPAPRWPGTRAGPRSQKV